MEQFQLDCRGFRCPMPMVELFKKIKSTKAGDTIEILSDDPAFSHDVKAWCTQTGNDLVELSKEEKTIKAVIKKT